jgi:hypothetical protein
MKKFSRPMRTPLVTAIATLVVLVALCFSIGEGLRLTPFPVFGLTTDITSDPQLGANGSQELSLYKYGPLDVPTQKQKRNKRPVVDFVCPPTDIARDLPTYLSRSTDHGPVRVVSSLFRSRAAGRAPPSIS